MASKEFCALFMATPPVRVVKVQVKDQASNDWIELPSKILPMSRFEAKQKQMKDYVEHYRKNIESSNELLIRIQEGLKAGMEYKELFELASECISDMRGDEQFRKQTRREIERRSHQ